MNARRPLGSRLPRALLALGLGACVTPYPQRVPGPIPLAEEAPRAERTPSNAPPITVQRSSDPVWVRRPGERGDSLLPFYKKRERVPAGALVRIGAGGRAELLWAPDASSVNLFDEGRVSVGDPERDEPMLRFHSVSRALLMLTPEDRVELVGGALLAGDPLQATGPVLLESAPGSILRVTNQSKLVATIAFRSERLELAPGESIDLPVLAGGSWPREQGVEPQRLETRGHALAIAGRVERADVPGGVGLTALEPTLVTALGVAVLLEAGESARFSGLSQVQPEVLADPSANP